MESEDLSQTQDNHLLDMFNDALSDYEAWIAKEFPLNPDWIEELESLMFDRSEIHRMAEELRSRNIAFDQDRLRLADGKWQAWIRQTKDDAFRVEHPRDEVPKSEWWHWIDRIEELTEDDLAYI